MADIEGGSASQGRHSKVGMPPRRIVGVHLVMPQRST
jgi:hypothetical protein